MYTHYLLTALTALASVSVAAVIPRDDSSASSNSSSDDGAGVDLTNKGAAAQTFYFCENVSNGDGTADPGFTSGTSGCASLYTSVTVAAGATTAVPLPTSFKGRVARSTLTPATWVEIKIKDDADGLAWGDVSLQIGCDGAATVAPSTGAAETVGFASPADIVAGAPSDATETRSDGVKVISIPWSMGSVVNQAAVDYLDQTVPGGNSMAYITGTDSTKCTSSSNNRLAVTFY